MKENPLVSIIVPVYKVEKYLEKCVNSIINQTYKNLEVILIDDGSPDKCPKICDELAEKDNRIKVLHKKNNGLMSAWIDGFKLSTGEYIAFVDSDDWVENSYIEILIKPFLDDHAIDLTICDYYYATDTTKEIKPASKNSIYGIIENEKFEKIKSENIRNFPYYRWNKLFKRDFIDNNLKYCDTRISLCEDVCITAATIFDAKKILVINSPLYNYYKRPDSIVNSYNPKLLQNFDYFNDMFIKVLDDKKYNTDRNLSEHLIYLLFILCKNIICSKEKNKKQLLKEIYTSKIYENFKICSTKNLSLSYKLFAKALKIKNFLLLSIIIKLKS